MSENFPEMPVEESKLFAEWIGTGAWHKCKTDALINIMCYGWAGRAEFHEKAIQQAEARGAAQAVGRSRAHIESLRDEMRQVGKMLDVNRDVGAFGWMAAIEKLHELEQKIARS